MAAALAIAREHGGVAHRRELHMAGIDRHTVRAFVRAGRWRPLGRHTVDVLAAERTPAARAWWAVWESGSGACLDGASSMIAHGVTGFQPEVITVSVPRASTAYRLDGVTLRRPRLVVRRCAPESLALSWRTPRSRQRNGQGRIARRRCCSAFPCNNACCHPIGSGRRGPR